VANVAADELFILPARYNGRDCYRMCWGVYDNRTKASGAVKSVPAYFREGGAKPRVVTTESVVP
jgi:septal ring-binding cell division protein DamX